MMSDPTRHRREDVEGSHVETEAEVGERQPQPRDARSPQKLGEAGRTIPWGLRKERGPGTAPSNFWPPGL